MTGRMPYVRPFWARPVTDDEQLSLDLGDDRSRQPRTKAAHAPRTQPLSVGDEVVRSPPVAHGATNITASAVTDWDRLLTTKEAGRLLNVSHRTLEKKRVTGGGPPYRRLGDGEKAPIRYTVRDLMEWAQANRHRSTSEYPTGMAPRRGKR